MDNASSWLGDAAVALQIQEVGGHPTMLALSPDPARVRLWFATLCVFRADPAIMRALEDDLSAYRLKPGFTPVVSWLTLLKFAVANNPEEYPFSLNEREFSFHATQNFGGDMANVSGVYKPPSFYKALGQDVVTLMVGAILGAGITLAIPEWAAIGAVARLAPGVARATATSLGTMGLKTVFPGGSWDAAKKDRLWRRYSLDHQRRKL